MTVPTVTGLSAVDISGKTPQNTPELSANLLVSYRWSLGSSGSLSAQVDDSYQSEVFYSNGTITTIGDPSSYDRNEVLGQGGYSLWNTQLS